MWLRLRASGHGKPRWNAACAVLPETPFARRPSKPQARHRPVEQEHPRFHHVPSPADVLAAVSRRGFLKLAGASGLANATGSFVDTGKAATTNPDGTPEPLVCLRLFPRTSSHSGAMGPITGNALPVDDSRLTEKNRQL
jgi:hypothetical protein